MENRCKPWRRIVPRIAGLLVPHFVLGAMGIGLVVASNSSALAVVFDVVAQRERLPVRKSD
jgi:hypothetical protein